MKITPKKIAMLALLTTLSIVLSFVDNLISVAIPIPLPGFKLGIANLVTLFLVCYFNLGQTLTVVILRCFIASIYGGGITVFLISLSGGIFAVFAMYVIHRFLKKNVSAIGISILGAAFHNIGQVLMVILLLNSPNYIFYLPILLVLSLATGFIIGFVGTKIFPRLNVLKQNLEIQ